MDKEERGSKEILYYSIVFQFDRFVVCKKLCDISTNYLCHTYLCFETASTKFIKKCP